MWLHKLLPLSGFGNSDQLLLMLFSYASVNSTCAQPPAPCPRATAGHLPAMSVPGMGHLQILHCPGAGHLPTPGPFPRGAGRRWNWLMRYEGNKMKRKREWSSLQRFSQTVYIPKGLVHSFPAESIEITIINAVYSNINFKLSLSVFLPFPRTSFGEISEIRRRVCFKFYARILRKYNQKMKLKSMRFYPWW